MMMAASLVRICDLPDEVLYEIFSKLTKNDLLKYVVHVCKRWNAIVNEYKIFWYYLQLAVHCDNFINCSYLEESINSDHSLQDLYPNELLIGEKDLVKVSGLRCIKFSERAKAESLPALLLIRILDIISKICKNIEKVEFDHCFGATSKDFLQLLKECYVDINEIRFNVDCGCIIPYDEISKFCNITTLVSHDYGFKRSDLYSLADCETLSCLWILYSRSPKVDDILYFLEKKKNVLKELGLGMKLQDCILEKIKECHRLEVLFATNTRRITNRCIKAFNNLPCLQYCSLHGAKFELETLWGMISPESSGISSQLIILDMTGYAYAKEFVDCIYESEEFMKMWKDSKFVTFDNCVNRAVTYSWYTKSSFHWMYQNELIRQDFTGWKKQRSVL